MKLSELLEGLDYETTTYLYDGDKLVRYNGLAYVYDEMGCPTTYKNKTLTWSNGRLKTYDTTTFKYDTLGRRITKKNHEFVYAGLSKHLLRMKYARILA